MRKLVPARVLYWDDFLISYPVYTLTASFHISLFEGTRSSLTADRFHAETGSRFAFTRYRCEISYRGVSRWPDILWSYHVNKYRAMRGIPNELAPARKSPRCHVNTPLADLLVNRIFTSTG